MASFFASGDETRHSPRQLLVVFELLDDGLASDFAASTFLTALESLPEEESPDEESPDDDSLLDSLPPLSLFFVALSWSAFSRARFFVP